MTRIFSIAALIILSLPHKGDALFAAGQTGGVTRELTQIEQLLVKSWVDGDRAAVDAILAQDWTVIDMTGHVLTKEQVMKEFGSGDRRIESGSIDDLKVREFGEIAVVTGRSELTGSYRGKRVTVVQRFTDVFTKRDGRWQAVASQGTQIAQ